jgi:cytidylate kinase
MDGRDVGTVVFPNAELKLFVTASADIRAKRRFHEQQLKGISESLESIKENLAHRDHLDVTRKIGPLKQAEDAIVLDNSNMTEFEQLQFALALVNNRIVKK